MKISSHQAAVTAIKTALTGKTAAAGKAKRSEPLATLKRAGPADVSKIFSRKVGGLPADAPQIKMMYGLPTMPADKLPGPVLRYGLIPHLQSQQPTEPQIIMKYGIAPKPGSNE
ncbi:MAG: hypothetical protein AB1714_07860 [Acidobacteriota bacterium]